MPKSDVKQWFTTTTTSHYIFFVTFFDKILHIFLINIKMMTIWILLQVCIMIKLIVLLFFVTLYYFFWQYVVGLYICNEHPRMFYVYIEIVSVFSIIWQWNVNVKMLFRPLILDFRRIFGGHFVDNLLCNRIYGTSDLSLNKYIKWTLSGHVYVKLIPYKM